ncbi:MAG: MFS transporter [Deltaproteobacteria bacterium]|nr:MFS transporter [Deltaproteobacteria bacterium]
MPHSRFETFAALRHKNFRLFYTGQAVSLMGSWMQAVALNWLVLILTDSPFFLGLVGALQTLPMLIFSFWGGVVADRARKRYLLGLTQSSMMLLALVLGILVAGQFINIWLICVLVFLGGTAMAFDIPVRQAFIVDLVGKPDLPNAIALNSTLFNGTRVMGPALAGILIAQVGLGNCFFINGLSFLATLFALIWMDLPPAAPAPRLPFGQALRELKDYLQEHRDLKQILVLLTTISVLGHSYYVLLPMLARDVLGAGPEGFGLLMAVNGLGAFAGGLTLARRLRHRPPMPSFLSGLGIFVAGLLALSLVRNFYLALPAIALVGWGMVTQLSTGNSLLQLNVPDRMRGRIMSLFGFIIMGSVPLGSMLYGVTATSLGPSLTITLGSLLAAAGAGFILIRHPRLRHLDFRDLKEPSAPPLGPGAHGAP